jgi:hypothetical protein
MPIESVAAVSPSPKPHVEITPLARRQFEAVAIDGQSVFVQQHYHCRRGLGAPDAPDVEPMDLFNSVAEHELSTILDASTGAV